MMIESRLNNIFDQYDQEENRVTNAFLQTLAKNKSLLKSFLSRYFGTKLGKRDSVVISSQKEPFGLGDRDEDREKIEGIPDGWIIIDDKIAIVFESKISRNAVKKSQLEAHVKRIKGYSQKHLCVITPDEASPIANIHLNEVHACWISWKEIYGFIDQSELSQGASEYLREQLKEYLAMKEDLVGFQGIVYPSGVFNPREAKIIIKNLIREIKPDILKVYPKLKYEREKFSSDVHPYTVFHRSTWSFLGADSYFTKDIHVTFWLAGTHIGMGFTIPNGAKDRWIRLKKIFADDQLFDLFISKLFKIREKTPNLYLEFVHRHFLRRRDGVVDGILEMDIDTINGGKKVKANKLWLQTLREIVKNKEGYNGQFMIRTRYFYKDYPETKKPAFKSTVIKTAYALKDMYDFLCET